MASLQGGDGSASQRPLGDKKRSGNPEGCLTIHVWFLSIAACRQTGNALLKYALSFANVAAGARALYCVEDRAVKEARFTQPAFGWWLPKLLVSSLLLALLGGCGTAPVAGRSGVMPTSGAASQVSPNQASDVTIYAVGLVGTPYRYGGNTPDTGFDCSGLIGHVYKTRAGVALPRSVAALQNWGQSLAPDSIRSGDLVFFGKGDVATHAGIFVGNGRFVHAPSTGGTVRLEYLSAKHWASQRVAFRRP